MSFATWRQQARLLESLRRLAAGEPVTKVALDCGYASASAFGAMFRRSLGVPPAAYFAAVTVTPAEGGTERRSQRRTGSRRTPG
jgi:AraC-like DNA-binding protein